MKSHLLVWSHKSRVHARQITAALRLGEESEEEGRISPGEKKRS